MGRRAQDSGALVVDRRPVVIAHRTCPLDAPENSLAGIALASRCGADVVELDVRLTLDGVAVCCHDAVPWRTLRWPFPVRATPASLLALPRASGWPGRLPTLRFADALCALGDDLTVAVDVKVPAAMAVVVAELEAAGLLGRSWLWCRDPATIRGLADSHPNVTTALLSRSRTEAAALTYLDMAVAARASAVSLDEISTTPRVVAAGHDAGLVVHSWVKDPSGHAKALLAGVDGIVTDWPRECRQLLCAQRDGSGPT